MTGMQGTGSVDLCGGPSHDPETVDEGLGGEGAEFGEEFVGDFSAGGGALGKGSDGLGGEAGEGAAEGGGEHGSVVCFVSWPIGLGLIMISRYLDCLVAWCLSVLMALL